MLSRGCFAHNVQAACVDHCPCIQISVLIGGNKLHWLLGVSVVYLGVDHCCKQAQLVGEFAVGFTVLHNSAAWQESLVGVAATSHIPEVVLRGYVDASIVAVM